MAFYKGLLIFAARFTLQIALYQASIDIYKSHQITEMMYCLAI